jgi:LysM repeat protein
MGSKIRWLLLIGILSGSVIPINPMTEAAAKNGNQQGLWHTVRRGETVWELAKHYDMTVATLKKANSLYAS